MLQSIVDDRTILARDRIGCRNTRAVSSLVAFVARASCNLLIYLYINTYSIYIAGSRIPKKEY